MSRSGYSEEIEDNWSRIIWRGAVTSAIRGRRGQAFLKELLAALDAMPEPRLIKSELEAGGDVCAIGAVGKARGIDMSKIDSDDYERVALEFGIATALAREIVYMNDEGCSWKQETSEERFERMREWIDRGIRKS